jgi:hypothetical protein
MVPRFASQWCRFANSRNDQIDSESEGIEISWSTSDGKRLGKFVEKERRRETNPTKSSNLIEDEEEKRW